ncbi:F-box domain-containing [Fusarium albosuccineum]|uniref:F-box domain-containing n=1 Tax=Fusarium albosuccineum TaxID=1237068 RepID=A0A8H4L8Q0_9HYPO|nr:F-box domain-containing [Fusarium albosuccineum]
MNCDQDGAEANHLLRWASLPAEIQSMILGLLKQHRGRSSYAAVSREWQAAIEAENFGQIQLGNKDLQEFEEVARRKRRKLLIKRIWLNIELERYGCRSCQRAEPEYIWRKNEKTITEKLLTLFTFLKGWRRGGGGDLSLELNAYSPSDREHWHQHCYFGGPGEDTHTKELHDPNHGWYYGRKVGVIRGEGIERLFGYLGIFASPTSCQLPKVTAITTFIIRRQLRRQLLPSEFQALLSRFPRLQGLVYEPWRQWFRLNQEYVWDRGLKNVSVFEDFNEDYPARLATYPVAFFHMGVDPIRITTPRVGAAFASRSLKVEELSVSFMTDARDFLDACQPGWRWEHLRSLVLTSRLMTPSERQVEVTHLLRDAGVIAMRMPELQTMALWNGAKGEACAFTYRRGDGSITWRGTWDMKLEPCVIEAWRRVVYQYSRQAFRAKSEIIGSRILSHGDAIHHLDLPAGVIDPVSLWQIREEHS